MNKKEQIYNLLFKEELTIKQIANRLGFKEDFTRTTIHRLENKDNKIISEGKNGNSKIYKAKHENTLEKQILKKFIPVFLDNDLDIELTDNEFELIKNIFEEVREIA